MALLLLQVRRGTRLVIMDQSGGADAIAIARSVRGLARRKVYVVAVRHLPRTYTACQQTLDMNPETPWSTHDHTLDMSYIQPKHTMGCCMTMQHHYSLDNMCMALSPCSWILVALRLHGETTVVRQPCN